MCKTCNKPASVKIIGLTLLCLTIFWHGNTCSEVIIDPTQPPGIKMPGKKAGIVSAPEWTLSSTLIASARRLATINGKTVSVGEHVGGAQVMTIEPATVSLRKGSKVFVVELSPRDYKRIR